MYLQTPLFFSSFFLFFCLVFHCLCSTSSKTTRIVQHWEDVMFRPAPMRKWQHFRAQKSWHDTTLSRKPFFCFSSLRAKQLQGVGSVPTSRRLYFGEASLQSPGACTSKSIQYYYLYITTYTLTFFHKPLPPVIQHICLENSICENVEFCAQSCWFFALLCFTLYNDFISAIL